ncbi:GNAT family N-acetyltransferase [Spirosoma sp. KNUC1025]|uniref:GNAT family N-acetyltransferase n=1 Tax=Spirosoma sp. KNUC1025 TaxID=2894082 RepID=UPI003868F5B2|nr:GNAT family N-acetyltransferase [Spirosoma sp. KNUC1025]
MTIDCGLCRLRPFQLSDADSVLKHANNRALWLNLRDRFPHPYTQADAEWWVNFASTLSPLTGFAIDIDGEAVGAIGLELHSDIERCSAEVGYWLGEQHWGKGIMSAALRAITDYGFNQFELTRIYAVPFVRNAPSVRILEKAGYQLEGLMRRSAIKDGVILDQFLYASVR